MRTYGGDDDHSEWRHDEGDDDGVQFDLSHYKRRGAEWGLDKYWL